MKDFSNLPCAIVPSVLSEMVNIGRAPHLVGDLAALEKRFPQKNPEGGKPYEVRSGVAVLPISGVLAKNDNIFMRIFGGTATERAKHDLNDAAADASVKAILLHIDSPGGTVDGTQALAAAVRLAASKKPVIAFADGLMASAAYWIGSAASEIVASSDTTQIGSIGVVAAHRDISGLEARTGIKTTEITAGKYKRIASSYAPLTEEGSAEIQSQVDALYSIFVHDVASNRNTTPQKVLSDMADGRVFLARQALDAGLIDRIDGLDATLARIQAGGNASVKPRRSVEEEFASDEALKAEFGSLATYQAYRQAMASGHFKQFGAKGVFRSAA